jgi:hypothetical protein
VLGFDADLVGAVLAAVIGVAGVLTGAAMSQRATRKQDAVERAERTETAEREMGERRDAAANASAERAEALRAAAAEREAARREDFLMRALEHFAGGTQHRSIGIAIVEGCWQQVTQLHDVIVAVLVNQLVYLTTVVDPRKTTAHELQNLERILDLLTAMGAESEGVHRPGPADHKNIADAGRPSSAGLDMSSRADLRTRVDRFFAASIPQDSAPLGGGL